jgi:glycosyltransferase involved in cell wall biosynthesis
MKKRFVTIFEKAENIHLIKDVGQIPYLMHKYFDYDATLIAYKNKETYDYLEEEVQGLKMGFIPKVKVGRYSLSILWYLFFNAKKIDILHLFHHREKTYLNFLMYKWRNPSGIAFLKSDIGLDSIKEYGGLVPKKRPKYAVRDWLFHKVLPKLDVVSIESAEGHALVAQKYVANKEKFLYMPNGINIEKMYELCPPKAFEEKENIILTVGRIGAPEKNNELLLDACTKIDLKDWKVVFVGPIEEAFQLKIESFYTQNSHLREKVIFTGAIYERVKLYDWYAKSKIFCLTSHAESFGFVLIEAMAYGNAIVTTPVSSANEITEGQKCGEIVDKNKVLEGILQTYMTNQELLGGKSDYAQKRAIKYYDWKNILGILDDFMKKEN